MKKHLRSFHLEISSKLREPTKGKYRLKALVVKKRVIFPNEQVTLTDSDLDKVSQSWLRQPANLRRARRDNFICLSSVTTADSNIADFCQIGVEAKLIKSLCLDNGERGYLVKGINRLQVDSLAQKEEGGYDSLVKPVDGVINKSPTRTVLGQVSELKILLSKLLKLNDNIDDASKALLLNSSDNPARLCDLVAPHLTMTYDERLPLLSLPRLTNRLSLINRYVKREIEMLKYSSDIQRQVEEQISDGERANFIKEQIKTLQDELAEIDGSGSEVKILTTEIEKLNLPAAVKEVTDTELEKLDLAPYGSTEYMISHQYLNWLKDLPWHSPTVPPPNLDKARRVLNKNHFGLNTIKERILEHLAVIIHKGKIDGQVLLLVGPPGVGKTSLVQSIADALGRKFIKISLGGMREEIEIRGLRRTYVGAMPGKVIQAIKQVGDNTAVILLDELDKIGSKDKNNDVQAALLEVLDYQHNAGYRDHYLDLPFDLSRILFVATANSCDDIPLPLLSRLETVELSSYSTQEKLKIANRHLLPQIRQQLGIASPSLTIDSSAMMTIINNYTQEAGVRQLRRKLEDIARKVIKRHVARGEEIPATVEVGNLVGYLGNPQYPDEPNDRLLPAGVAVGLAYTEVGGDIMYIETTVIPDKDRALILTGFLGKVMRESATMAKSFIAAHAELLSIDLARLTTSGLHVHLPDGATPKDGPSAGLAILLAMTSLLKDQRLDARLAVTGEITLRGQVLTVGGIKEKLIAAYRYAKREVIMPRNNLRDLLDVPSEILRSLTFYPVTTMDEALVCAKLLTVARPRQRALRLTRNKISSLLEQRS